MCTRAVCLVIGMRLRKRQVSCFFNFFRDRAIYLWVSRYALHHSLYSVFADPSKDLSVRAGMLM